MASHHQYFPEFDLVDSSSLLDYVDFAYNLYIYTIIDTAIERDIQMIILG